MAPAKKAKPAMPQGNSRMLSTVQEKGSGVLRVSLFGACLEEVAGKQFVLGCGSGPQHEMGVYLMRME